MITGAWMKRNLQDDLNKLSPAQAERGVAGQGKAGKGGPKMAKKKLNHRQALGAVLRARRVDAGMTMQEFAGKCGLSQAQISRIETGHQGFRLDTLMQLARVLGASVSALLVDAGL